MVFLTVIFFVIREKYFSFIVLKASEACPHGVINLNFIVIKLVNNIKMTFMVVP